MLKRVINDNDQRPQNKGAADRAFFDVAWQFERRARSCRQTIRDKDGRNDITRPNGHGVQDQGTAHPKHARLQHRSP